MNGKKIPVREFMAKYGDKVTVYDNDLLFCKSLEVTVFEGTDIKSVKSYLSETGFSDISGMDGFFSGRRDATLTMSRDTTDYAQRLFGDSFKGKAASILFKGMGIESLYKKSIGNRVPMAEREHVRAYDLGNGDIAVLMHKDPGVEHYTNKGATGLLEAALYHFGLVDTSRYKAKVAA